MKCLEDFLINLASERDSLVIVGGSPLFEGKLPEAISINGFHKECSIAAINSNRSDFRRCNGKFETLIAPNPMRKIDASVIRPKEKFIVPENFPDRQPTTYFSLILTCDRLNIPTEIYGVCGRASKYHYGDWEMWYMKHKTSHVKIHDPRPRW
jgi:hypothetical protein